jgi:hypothetical protein
MPAHSSHLLQPLDVGCFGPLKRAYSGLVEQKMRLGYNHIDKFDFLKAYPAAHLEVFTPLNIQNGFAAAGIHPLQLERVLEKLNIYILMPTPPPSRASQSTNSSWLATPYTLRQLHKQASSVKKLLNRRSESPSQIAIQQLIKGCEMAMHSAALLAKENHDLRAANEKEKQKRKQSKHQMTPNEGLSIQEARDLIQARNEQDNEIGGPSIDSALLPLEPPKRAPPRCTNCFIVGHTRTRCPTRHTS